MQPFINAFPLPSPNSPEIPCDPNTDSFCPSSGETGIAALNASLSNRSTLDAASLRVDRRLNDKMTLFGRYNYAPSELLQRGFGGVALNGLDAIRVPTQTVTLGVTWTVSPGFTNDLRVNYSRVNATSAYSLDNFGGAVPFSNSLAGVPSPYTAQNSQVYILLLSVGSLISEGRLLKSNASSILSIAYRANWVRTLLNSEGTIAGLRLAWPTRRTFRQLRSSTLVIWSPELWPMRPCPRPVEFP